jgi:hypothetical protein
LSTAHPRSARTLTVLIGSVAALALSALLLPAAAPARIATHHVGDRVTFKYRTLVPNASRYGVFITVAARRRHNRYGGLKRTQVGTFARMVATGGGHYQYTTPPSTSPTWFMRKRGTYYWQMSIRDCSIRGCHVYSRVHLFKVV